MPLVYLFLLICMMFVGGMLIRLNPEPVTFRFWCFGTFQASASVLEVVGYSALFGASAAAILHTRSLVLSYRERRNVERDTAALREDNAHLRRDAENSRTASRLLEARLAEAEERFAQLEARAVPLLTMQPERRATPERPVPKQRPKPRRPSSRRQRR
ncbi:MAG: LapA family protein [Armatimonadetes bacterium]|nr:LapA family protein [Armatimonadota bacterium]